MPVLNPLNGAPLGPGDQRSKIETFNIAPTWSHTLSTNALLNVSGYARRDSFNYYPSQDRSTIWIRRTCSDKPSRSSEPCSMQVPSPTSPIPRAYTI